MRLLICLIQVLLQLQLESDSTCPVPSFAGFVSFYFTGIREICLLATVLVVFPPLFYLYQNIAWCNSRCVTLLHSAVYTADSNRRILPCIRCSVVATFMIATALSFLKSGFTMFHMHISHPVTSV